MLYENHNDFFKSISKQKLQRFLWHTKYCPSSKILKCVKFADHDFLSVDCQSQCYWEKSMEKQNELH